MKATFWTLAGSYRAVANPDSTLDVLAGARLLDVNYSQGFELTGNIGPIPLPGRSGSAGIHVSDWDAIVGVKGRAALSGDRAWYVPYYLDVGTGDTKLTWQIMGGVGYAFSWGDRRHMALPRLQQQFGQAAPGPEHERASVFRSVPLVTRGGSAAWVGHTTQLLERI